MSLYAYNRSSGVTFSIEKPNENLNFIELDDDFIPDTTKLYKINNGKLITMERLPNNTELISEPTTEDDLMNMAVDLDYRLTLLELGVE